MKITDEGGGAMKTVDEMMAEAFSVPRNPRSDEYKAGARKVLNWRVNGVRAKCPYTSLVQQDAYFSGCDEGHAIADRNGIPIRSAITGLPVESAGRLDAGMKTLPARRRGT